MTGKEFLEMSIHVYDLGVSRLTAPPLYQKLLDATVYSTDLFNGYLVVLSNVCFFMHRFISKYFIELREQPFDFYGRARMKFEIKKQDHNFCKIKSQDEFFV